jgi:hypothetical protein
MKSSVKKAWVKELESGKYIQGHTHLHSHGRHCCLGVLCEIAVKQGVIKKYEGILGRPPKEVIEWAGLDRRTQDHLITMNDNRGNSFTEIAKHIKNRLKG